MDFAFSEKYTAVQFDSRLKMDCALKMLSKINVSEFASQQNVSRKFLYQQKDKAVEAVNNAFTAAKEEDDEVLYTIPVTAKWLESTVLSLTLSCRSTYSGIKLFFSDMLDRNISDGKIYDILLMAKLKAMDINESESLANIKIALLDELFHHNKPVLTGIDNYSLYCFLLECEDKRDGDTWGINLLEAVETGFNPDQVIADNAKGIEAGAKIACPNAVYSKDNFHIVKDLQDMKRFFANKLKSAESKFLELQTKMDKAKLKGTGNKLSSKYNSVLKQLNLYEYLYKNISVLVSWFRFDVIFKAGSDPKIREELYEFVVEEFEKLSKLHPHRLKEICASLRNQKEALLAFTKRMEVRFAELAAKYKCSLSTVWKICELSKYNYDNQKYQSEIKQIYSIFRGRFYDIQSNVKEIMNSISSSSSLVENFNSRLSGRFFIHRYIGNGYLNLLRFYMNHSPILRSSKKYRKGKTPAELMLQQPHLHWLEMLGLAPFRRLVA